MIIAKSQKKGCNQAQVVSKLADLFSAMEIHPVRVARAEISSASMTSARMVDAIERRRSTDYGPSLATSRYFSIPSIRLNLSPFRT